MGIRTAAMRRKPGVQGGGGELPGRVDFCRSLATERRGMRGLLDHLVGAGEEGRWYRQTQ